MFKWQIRYAETTNLSQFTINFRKSHRQPQRTFQLVCEYRVLFVSVDIHVCLCWPAASKVRASNSSAVSTFHLQTSLFIQLHKQKSRIISSTDYNELHLGDLSELDTYSSCFFFLTMTDSTISHPGILTFPLESPCISLCYYLYLT